MSLRCLLLKKRVYLLLLVVMFLVLITSNVSCASVGRGSVAKLVAWEDESPIEGARVRVDELGFELYTDFMGWAVFQGIPVGDYHLFVDFDCDGVWDTEDEFFSVVDGQVTQLYNYYALPTPPMHWHMSCVFLGVLFW